MKLIFFILLFLLSSIGFAQNNYIVITEDGRRVLLKADFTWEYIDGVKADILTTKDTTALKNKCNLTLGYKEPKLNSKIQSQLKKGRATIKHVKTKVANDYNCKIEEVILLYISEKKETAKYTFCANGEKVFYKRFGHKILEKGKLF